MEENGDKWRWGAPNEWFPPMGQALALTLSCGSNVFQGYFDDAKESRVKQIPKIQE